MPNIENVSTIANLASTPPTPGLTMFLNQDGREGLFECTSGVAPTDPLNGLYVPSSTAGFYWARVWDGIHGQPEWFGAVKGGPDCLAALDACVTLCACTQLSAGTYYISSTLVIDTEYRALLGAPGVADGVDILNGTQLVCTNAGVSVLQLGPVTQPAKIDSFPRGIVARDITCRHSGPLVPPSGGIPGRINATKCIVATYIIEAEITRLRAHEPLVGFFFYGLISSHIHRCRNFRHDSYGTGDFFYGFWVRGIPRILNGGNASLYIDECGIEGSGSLTVDKLGMFADGAASDLFVDRFEAAFMSIGILYDGAGENYVYGKEDVHFRNCVLDQCSDAAFRLANMNPAATITLSGGYYQANAATSISVIELNGGAGSVALTGGLQIIGGENGNLRGVLVTNQPNCTIDNSVQITDCGYGVVALAGDGGCIEATIKNPIVGSGTQEAVYMGGVKGWRVAPRATGKPGAFSQGIYFQGASNDKCICDPSRVDAAALTGTKVNINVNVISAPGYYTSAGMAGPTGAGIFVTGVTV